MKGLSAFACCLFALAGAMTVRAQQPQYDAFPETAGETEAFLKQRFPAGSPVKKLEQYLESQTFNCAPAKDPVVGGNDEKLKGSYLYCQRTVAWGFQAGKRWQVAIVEQKGAVKDLHASYGIVGR